MKQFMIFAVLMAFFSLTAAAQDSKTVSGILVDKHCASGMVKKGASDAMAAAAKHTRECAMEADCAAAGYGVMSEGKWIPFDDKGNEKAADFLKNTKKNSNLRVEVNGTMEGDKMAVNSITEAKSHSKKASKKSGT